MKISRLIIPDFQQFRAFDLDLTAPGTGQPLEKVCFIGRNGTGKSTLLRLLGELLKKSNYTQKAQSRPVVWLKARLSEGVCWLGGYPNRNALVVCGEEIEQSQVWPFLRGNGERSDAVEAKMFPDCLARLQLPDNRYSVFVQQLSWHKNGDLVIYSPSDTTSLLRRGQALPATTLNQALGLFKDFPTFHEVDTQEVAAFWNVLIYHIKKREVDWQTFLERPENRTKSVADADREFQRDHPEILVEVADLWNRILTPAGLEFDYKGAKKPVQLNENLEAFVRLRASGQQLHYNALSTGIRNFLFRLGHIFALYFGRDIKRGFLLLDEPENSLFPDFLYDLVDIYLKAIRNTQFFVATHNPIIAAQFRPEERVILEFDEQGRVTPRRGTTPVGDDPNDLLVKDFEVRSIYGREGLAKWERFLEVRRLIKNASDPAARRALIDEYMQIGNAYNFVVDALSSEKN